MSAGDHLSQQFGAYEDVTEHVPISYLRRLRVQQIPESEGAWGQERVGKLKESIAKEGIREPLIIEYSQRHLVASLGEGYHRLAAAHELGLKEAPARVLRSTGRYQEKPPPGLSVQRAPEDWSGYARGDLRPSEIGIPTREDKGRREF